METGPSSSSVTAAQDFELEFLVFGGHQAQRRPAHCHTEGEVTCCVPYAQGR